MCRMTRWILGAGVLLALSGCGSASKLHFARDGGADRPDDFHYQVVGDPDR